MAMLRRAVTGTGFPAVRRGLRCFSAEARAAVDMAQDVGFYPNPEGPSRGDAVNNFKLAAVGVIPQRGSAVHGGPACCMRSATYMRAAGVRACAPC